MPMPESQADFLSIAGLHKMFGECRAVRGADLSAAQGQLVALLGPSGCGKTTLLRLVAGFEWPDSGEIRIAGRVVAGDRARVPAEDRRVGMVFQDYALFPHLSAAENVAFGLRGPAREKALRAGETLALVGLDGLGGRMPYELSGGQQQRVALARALAPRPDVLLLDEPFSNLDAALRAQVRHEVRQILRGTGTTCLFVTHDQEEALSFADRVAVMFDGQIVQIDSPERLYRRPASRAVASFVGEANYLPGQADGLSVGCALGWLPLAEPGIHGPVDVLIRPEMLRLSPDPAGNARTLWREFYGHNQRIGLHLDDGTENGTELVARVQSAEGAESIEIGQRAQVSVAGAVVVFPAAG